MRKTHWLLLLVLALLAGACSGSDPAEDTDTAAATATSVTTNEATDAATTEEEAATDEATTEEEDTEEATEEATSEPASEGGTIRVGFIPGPYADMFREGIAPIMAEAGWEVEIEEISDFTIPNQATMDGDLDGSIFQNDAFMNLFNESNGGDLTALLKIPSAPLGIYPGRGTATSAEGIEAGSVIGITSEASNLARSLNFMESLGLLTVGEVAQGSLATQNDLADNPMDLQFELLDAPQIPRALPDVDYGVALGNHVYAADNVTLADAIALEEVPEASQITITVREENAEAEWAQIMVEAFESDEFREYIEGDENFASFAKPSWW